MKNFFKTLFTWNWANIGKAVVGVAAGLLVVEASPAIALPATVVAIASGVTAIGSFFGVHAIHLAEPPKVDLGDQPLP